MHYLITGGAGFIGCHLAEKLLGAGHSVTVIDDLCTGAIQNIERLKVRRGFNYIVESIFNRHLLAELIDDCDAVFHLAASVGVRLIVESPVRTIENNVKGTEVVLEFASKKKKKVLITSTSEVYGKSTKIPFTEEDDLVIGGTQKGRWSYACSKAIDEFLALAYWKEKGLPVVIVRLFNTVGPRQTGRYGMVLPNFVRAALAGEAAGGLRRRHPVALLLPRRRHRRGAGPTDRASRRGGRDLQRRQRGRDLHQRTRPTGQIHDAQRFADSINSLRSSL